MCAAASKPEPIVGGIELGGTKSVALIARGNTVLDMLRVPTGDPGPTLDRLSAQLAQWAESHAIAALGIGSFGPIGLDSTAVDYGSITTTPKLRWSGVDVRGHFASRFAVPIGFDTDVAGAALAEERWGAAAGCHVHVYLTIGTGIGGGVVVDGRPLHGMVHPELGHVRVRRLPGDSFPGICPWQGDCIEGLASGPAIAARAGMAATELPPDHPVWSQVAEDLAELMSTLILTLSPERILIGGGVGSGQAALLPPIREQTARRLGGYVAGLTPAALDRLIRAPLLGDKAGPLGAIALGLMALDEAGVR